MPVHRRLGAALAALCVALAISGCGDDGGGSGGSGPIELLDHIPDGAHGLRIADLAAMREQLGLPDDADIADFPKDEDAADDGQRRLAMTAGALLTYLGFGLERGLRAAIDRGEITAAASNVTTGAPGISVIRTSQPFDQIAAALEDQGYTRDGNVVRSRRYRGAPKSSRGSIEVLEPGERIKPAAPKPSALRQFEYPLLADGGDGLIVLGYRRPVEEAVSGAAGSDNPVRTLIEQVGGIARGATTIGVDCVQALAIGESFDPEAAEVRIAIDGEPSADRFRLPELPEPRLEYGEPEIEDGMLAAEVTGGREPDVPGVLLAGDLAVSALDPNRIYEC